MSAPAAGGEGVGGLLIVNADDWGGFAAGTDAIEACFAAGAISSATAMVYMADSQRAAALARERRRPIGLHLNLTQPFDGPHVPPAVRERQRRLCGHFARLGWRRWALSPDPRVRALVADAIRDQLEEFRLTYGWEPTHVDSHHHVHVCPDVLFSRALPRGTRVRQTLSPAAGAAAAAPGTLARRLKHALLARRFTTTARLWRVRELTPEGEAVPVADAVALARTQPVELMTHPSFARELAVLRTAAWRECVQAAPLGSYALLPGGAAATGSTRAATRPSS